MKRGRKPMDPALRTVKVGIRMHPNAHRKMRFMVKEFNSSQGRFLSYLVDEFKGPIVPDNFT